MLTPRRRRTAGQTRGDARGRAARTTRSDGKAAAQITPGLLRARTTMATTTHRGYAGCARGYAGDARASRRHTGHMQAAPRAHMRATLNLSARPRRGHTHGPRRGSRVGRARQRAGSRPTRAALAGCWGLAVPNACARAGLPRWGVEQGRLAGPRPGTLRSAAPRWLRRGGAPPRQGTSYVMAGLGQHGRRSGAQVQWKGRTGDGCRGLHCHGWGTGSP
jgi:hypothetical protein